MDRRQIQRRHVRRVETIVHQGQFLTRTAQAFSFERMYQAFVKLMMATNMIHVYMRGDGGNPLAQNISCESGKAIKTGSCVYHQVPVATTNMPDIASQERDDMRFVDQRDVIVDPDFLEPAIRNRKGQYVFLLVA